MKRENNKKFKKRKRNQKRSLTCRVLSMMFAIVLFCSTVLINTDYVSQASSFDDMVDMVEVEEDSAAADTSEDTGDDLDTDVNFESEEGSAETYSESDDFGSSDADFSSGENMFTDGTSESSTPTEEAAQPVSCIVNLKNETIEVKAEAPAGVLPNGTQMIVKAVENNTEDAELTDQYNKLAAKITEQLQSQGKNLDGFLAYNVSFTDADGNPVEPSDKVTYSFTYKEASSPELTDPAASTVTAAMIRTNKETSELELTELKAEEDKLTVETNESRQLTKAAFQSAATAAYTFVWSSTPAADDNENNENKVENGEVNNEEVNTDTNTENTEENGEETNTENNVENSEEEQNPEEAPDQEQTKMIRIITDEVNLRVAPSTEAEVIATVATDTQLPLLETVTGEDEFTWYKVSYEEAQAYVRSDMAEVVETEEQGTENEDANEEAEVQVEDEVTYYKTIDNVVVTATAAKGVLPDDAQFVVTPIESDNAQYEDIAARLEEKAENEEYSIAGFLAYDIYFLNNAGEKINPEDGKVKISMEYKNAAAPEEVKESDAVQMDAEEEETSQENTEAKELSVSVMHFVEENGEVTSVVDMTKENSAVVETNEAGEVQKAEFETESFSTFTITWKYTQNGNTYNKNLTVHLVYLDNGQYKKIPDAVNEYEENINDGENIELADLANEYKVEGYAYEQALESNKTKEISSISYNSNSHGKSGWFYKNDDGWTHATTNADYNIYLVYNKLSVWIKDDIMYTGNLILETDEATTNKINNAITAGKEVTYTWSKSTDGGKNYTPVERKRRGNNYNLSEDGKSLNVALDDGALNSEQTSVKYKVNIIIKEDDNNVENIESEVFDNEYWNELQNGSFETPTIDSTSSINEQYTNAAYKKAGGVWQSTGRPENNNVNIEIVNTRASFQSSYGWHGTDKAYDGNQFAELNCEAPGALYQDVMTYAGETMNYWLSHRARGAYPNGGYIPGEKDTMYLVIMPTSTAMTAASGSELKTQGQLEEYLRSRLPGVNLDAEASGDGNQKSEILYNNDGILISRITSDDQSWQRILKTDLYRSTSYLTRFFFMSGHTASGKDTVGNFLDKVGFSQQLPPVTEDEFTLQIKKSFEGLGSADIEKVKENISFKIKASKDGTDLTDDEITELFGCNTISGSDMAQQLDGSLQYTIANRKIGINDTYQVMITEEDAGLSGYTLNTSSTTSILTKDTAEPDVKEGSEFELKGKKTATVTFTNNYEADNQKKIHFTKIWDDNNNAYGTRPDSLAVTLHATYDANGKSNDLDLTDLVKPGVTITLNAASEWKCSWTVPVYYALDNGTKAKIDYTVTEGENTSDYVYKAVTEDGKAISGDGSDYNKQFNGSEITTPGNTTSAQSAPRKSRMRVASNNNELTTVADTNGTTTLTADTDYTKNCSGKTVTVRLLNGNSLEDGVTYTVSFRVKPSDFANTYYKEHQSYPDTAGDAGTGTTSAGKAGFYSNDSAQTNISYEIDGTSDGLKTASYIRPVVQVTTHTLTYKKEWNYPSGINEPTQDVKLNVSYSDGTTKEITLTKDEQYTYQESVPVTQNIVSVIESPVADYEASYSITDNGTKAVVTNNYNKVTASNITVTKVWEGEGPQPEIKVGLYRSVDGAAAEKCKEVTLNSANNWTYTWENLPQSEGSATNVKNYSYAVREESIPSNYQSSISYDYGNDTITATITNTYDPNCADENYYIANVLQTEKLHIIKTWDDNSNEAGKRPTDLSVNVNGMNFTLSGDGNRWTQDATILKKKNPTYNATEKLTSSDYKMISSTVTSADDGKNIEFVNQLKTKEITVHKVWNDGNAADRPKSVTIRLDRRISDKDTWEPYNTYTFTGESVVNGETWTYVIPRLLTTYQYRVVELNDNGEVATAENNGNYIPSITQSGDTFTITNTLKWSAVKKSADDNVGLSGAEFELKNTDNTVIATGKSGNGGAITWTPTDNNDLFTLHGVYTIHETKAPAGYMKNDSGWTVTFANGLLTQLNNAPTTGTAENGVVITLTNQKVYTLPSTGGNGIYWYMIGGMVLMSTAAWILYKNKCKEVLGK